MRAMADTKLIGTNTCKTCFYSTLVRVTIQAPERVMTEERRECRRYPPSVTSFIVGRTGEGAPMFLHATSWPQVDDNAECGEFKPRREGMN